MTIKQVVVGLISSAIQLLGYVALFQLNHKLCVAVVLIHFGDFIDHQLEHAIVSEDNEE